MNLLKRIFDPSSSRGSRTLNSKFSQVCPSGVSVLQIITNLLNKIFILRFFKNATKSFNLFFHRRSLNEFCG